MKELYFLTILDGVNDFLGAVTGIGLAIGIIAIVAYGLVNLIEEQNIPAQEAL